MRRGAGLFLLVAILCGCSKPTPKPVPTLADLSFVPLAKGISVFDGQGALETGRMDQFRVQKSYDDARRAMRKAGWNEFSRDSFIARFRKNKPPAGYHSVVVQIVRMIDQRQKNKLSPDWVNVMVFRNTKPPKPDPGMAEIRRKAPLFSSLTEKLRGNKKLTEAELADVVKAVDTTEPLSMMRGSLILRIAAEKGQYTYLDLAPIVERNACRTESSSIPSFVIIYLDFFAWDRTESADKVLDLIKLVNGKPRSESRYDEMERNSIDYIVARPTPLQRARVCELLLAKRNLSADDRAWGSEVIDEALKKEKGQAKAFWQFARRVFDARNPAVPKP